MTWGDCFSCLYGSYENSTCMARMRAGEDMFPCERKQLNIFDYSTYAPQLAWWLHFFPPDQMLITTSDVLHDPDRRIEVCRSTQHTARPQPSARRPCITAPCCAIGRACMHACMR